MCDATVCVRVRVCGGGCGGKMVDMRTRRLATENGGKREVTQRERASAEQMWWKEELSEEGAVHGYGWTTVSLSLSPPRRCLLEPSLQPCCTSRCTSSTWVHPTRPTLTSCTVCLLTTDVVRFEWWGHSHCCGQCSTERDYIAEEGAGVS